MGARVAVPSLFLESKPFLKPVRSTERGGHDIFLRLILARWHGCRGLLEGVEIMNQHKQQWKNDRSDLHSESFRETQRAFLEAQQKMKHQFRQDMNALHDRVWDACTNFVKDRYPHLLEKLVVLDILRIDETTRIASILREPDEHMLYLELEEEDGKCRVAKELEPSEWFCFAAMASPRGDALYLADLEKEVEMLEKELAKKRRRNKAS